MKIVIGNYDDPTDNRNLILNEAVYDHITGDLLSSQYAILSKVEGLETPPYRNGTGNWSGTDGGYISSQLYGARELTISGVYIENQALCDWSSSLDKPFDRVARLYIRSRLPIRKRLNVRIFFNNGMVFYTQGFCTDLRMDLDSLKGGEYQFTLYCPDPLLYRGSENGALGAEWFSSDIYKSKYVGYDDQIGLGKDHTSTPEYTSVTAENGVIWSTGGRSAPVNYQGDAEYYPQITAKGPLTNPRFTLSSTRQTFSLGTPGSRPARIQVTEVDNYNGIVSFEWLDNGAYPLDYSYQEFELSGGSGHGARIALIMDQDPDTSLWEVIYGVIFDIGEDYEVGDIVTPLIQDSTIFEISASQTLVIDMQERTVTVDGASRSYFITPGSQWFALQPRSINNIEFSSDGEEDNHFAGIRWRNGYQGI